MTLHERIQLLVIAFLIVLALTAIAGAVAIGQRDHLVAQARVYDVAREQVGAVLTAYVDQQAGVHSYVITQDESFLEPYEQGREQANRKTQELRETLADANPQLMADIDRFEVAAREWRTRTAEPKIAATRAGSPDEAADLVATGQGRDLFLGLRHELEAITRDIRAEQSMSEGRLAGARRLINVTLVMSFVSAAILLLVISAALQRWSTAPLDEITAALRQVTAGDLERRIPAVGPADIADLGRDADLMRRRIVAELDGARRAEQALRTRGGLVSVLRDQLAPSKEQLPPNVTMDAAFEPVKGVLAGDWYDAFHLEDSTVAMCLIDVSGHGQSTGVFALQAKNLLLAGARQLLEPGEVLAWMARALGDTGDSFLTCFIAKIDPATGACRYASAGHLPTLVTFDGTLIELAPTGPLLGPLHGEWRTESIQLSPGSVMVAYTDGVTETRGPANEEFGVERLRAVVAARAGEHPSRVIGTCMDTIHDFVRGEPTDDLTMVVVRWLPVPQPS
ncbi:MAG: SpoIIE family protein phosphatase [Nitriliruptorales bacterium]|nr:SpoIIE family protein phosphatase [Nitriliruptorales bacterium]